jgi:[acyl-carrier-protein] S-malonyltransferase/trans-AT polyketide synthase/acyltransferase/oxidoreductase domain-containing protein
MDPHHTAIVFPGQGCQRTGMGHDFHEAFDAARLVFQEASEALDVDVPALCFTPDARLDLTEFAQPAILVTEIAMLRSLEAEFGLHASWFGGHSLGEYTALVAAGALPLAEAARLVRERGRLMQDAVPVGAGRMVAVIGQHLDRDAVAAAIADLSVSLANDNCAKQVVLSGTVEATHRAETRLGEALGGSVRFIALDVSAPFHSSLMASVEAPFAAVLRAAGERIDAARAACVTSNFTGTFHRAERNRVIDCLVRQISNTVQWRANMEALASRAARFVEIGPGRPLRAFFKTIDIDVTAITDTRAAARAAAALGAV